MFFSQNETKKWYFGDHCALDFTTNPPTNLANGVMGTWEGCSSIADGSANLLFYTNGITIWNRLHLVMDNGTGLLGDNSSSQSALIVKQPGTSTLYFVFTTDGGANGLRYSVVDMSLAAGMGSVTVKNVLVHAPSTERLCGTKHCNGTDIWVISHDSYSSVFRANLVTAAGVDTTAILSNIGTNMAGQNSVGCMKVSPNGRKLGTALYSSSSFALFDFNASTGVLSNLLTLPVNMPAYGCEFSPDGTKFYGSIWDDGNGSNKLRQWDLCAGSDQSILASISNIDALYTGQLQLGPDGKIYQASAKHSIRKLSLEVSVDVVYGESMLGVIHNPNASGATLNFNNTGQAVNPALSMFGLPNFVSGFYKTPVAQFTYSANPAMSCLKAYFMAPPLINSACSATSYTINSLKWLFDDLASGAANSSTLVTPEHLYPRDGNYNVRLILYNDCGGVIDTLKQQVAVGNALANNTVLSLCSGQSSTLAAAGSSSTYSWSTGTTASSIVVTPTSNTTYSLSYTDTFGCLRRSVQSVTVNPMPAVTVSGKDTICTGVTVIQTVSGAVTYSWSTGSTNSAIKITPTTTTSYSVTGTSFEGCSVSKVVTVVVKYAPEPTIKSNTTVCRGSVATAVADGPGPFKWSNGTQGATLTVIPYEDHYAFSVKATYTNGCTRTNLVLFNIQPIPYVRTVGNTSVCAGQSLTQTAVGANTYTWSTGVTTNSVVLAPLNNTTYTVTGADTNNCRSEAILFVAVKPSAILNASVSGDVVICEGESALLSATGGNTYNWGPFTAVTNATNTSISVSPTVSTEYSVSVSIDHLCGITKTVQVTVNPKPKLFAGNDTTFNLEEPMFITASGSGTITWIAGDGIACADCRRTQVFPTQNTCYRAEAVNDDGCIVADDICVNIGDEFAVYLPNSFTPNGDGLNDVFIVSGFGISTLRMDIYDRWGTKIFSSSSQKEGWNGNQGGESCREGVYNWFLEYTSDNGQRLQKTGYVNLLR